jgi:hypothetical protein
LCILRHRAENRPLVIERVPVEILGTQPIEMVLDEPALIRRRPRAPRPTREHARSAADNGQANHPPAADAAEFGSEQAAGKLEEG